MIRSLLDISDLSEKELKNILFNDSKNNNLKNKNIGLIFEKPSTRTRLSFTAGIYSLGGNPIDIKFEELNISRDESFEDTFRALNCYLDGLIYRTSSHEKLIKASTFFKKPIINALSEKSHPCQIISDLYTLYENFKSLNLTILWIGDMNNVCFSLVEAANILKEIKLIICTPAKISKKIRWQIKDNVKIVNDVFDIELKKVNCVMTDVFISMNDKDSLNKINLLKNYSVSKELMNKTSKSCVFMHCLPAKIGLEVSKDVFLGNKSIVWKQAYNRMIAQKKLMKYIKWS